MTSSKSYLNEQRLNSLIAAGAIFVPDASWTDTGGLTNSWGKGSGYFKYKLILPGIVIFKAKGLNCTGAVVIDNTTILSAANGLISGYRPAASQTFPAYTDALKVSPVNASFYEAAALHFQPDGSVTCQGVQANATVLDCWGLIATDI